LHCVMLIYFENAGKYNISPFKINIQIQIQNTKLQFYNFK